MGSEVTSILTYVKCIPCTALHDFGQAVGSQCVMATCWCELGLWNLKSYKSDEECALSISVMYQYMIHRVRRVYL
jgi:hypothetical protein